MYIKEVNIKAFPIPPELCNKQIGEWATATWHTLTLIHTRTMVYWGSHTAMISHLEDMGIRMTFWMDQAHI